MNRNLSHLVKDIIRQQGLRVSPISNLYGVPIVYPDIPSTPTLNGSWVMHYLDSMSIFSPDEIISKLTSITLHAAPIVVTDHGNLTFNALEGTTMLSTTVDSTVATNVNVTAQCMGKQIRLYVGQSLVRGSANSINTTITVPQGKTEIHVVFYGPGTVAATLTLPSDINFSVGNVAPPAPRWLNSGSINSHYVDPKTGSTGVSVSWYNQENVGGWGVYAVTSTNYGIAGSILPAANTYIIKTNYSGVAPFDAAVVTINDIPIGDIEKSYYDDSTKSLVLVVSAYHDVPDFTLINSGTLNVLSYKMLASIDRTSNDPTITYVDLNVQAGNTYSYCLDSYSSFQSDIRSNKSIILNVNAGDVTPPGNVNITSASLQGTFLTINYITPPDPDYYLTNATYYYQGSGVGTVSNLLLTSNAGNPSTLNSISIDISQLVSGTIYLTTTDVLGNSQYVLSGTPYFFNTGGFIQWHGPLLFLFGGSGPGGAGAIMSGTLDMAEHQIIHIGSTDSQFTSTGQLQIGVGTGTSPFIISSTTLVSNLNADLLDGLNSSAFAQFTSDGGFITSNLGVNGQAIFSGTSNFFKPVTVFSGIFAGGVTILSNVAKILIDGTDSQILAGQIGIAENGGNLQLGGRGSIQLAIDNDGNQSNAVFDIGHDGNNSGLFRLDELGNVTNLGTLLPGAGLQVQGGFGTWGSGWTKEIEVDNVAIIKWTANAGGFRHAIGQTTSGLFFSRSTADDTSVSSTVALTVQDTGQIGLNTGSPKSVVHVVTSGNAGIPGYAVWQSDPSVAYGGGVLLTNNPNTITGNETSFKMTSTFNNTFGRARFGWVLNSDPETFIDSGTVLEFGSHQTIGFAGTPFSTSSLLKFAGVMDNLNGTTQRAFDFDAQSNSLATSAAEVIAVRGGTQSAVGYIASQVNAIHIFDAVLGASSTITTQAGLRIDSQTHGSTDNYAIITGTGALSFGDITAWGTHPNTSKPLLSTLNATALSGFTSGLEIGGTHTASANNDTLRGITIAPAYSVGGFTGTTAIGLRVGAITGAASNFAIQTSTGVVSFGDVLNMNNNVIQNIGNAGTDFLSNGGLTLANDLTVNALGAFDSTATPTKDFVLSYNGTAAKWQPRFIQVGFTSGQVTSQINADKTYTSLVNTVATPAGTPTAPTQAPVITAIYNGFIVDMSAYGSLPANQQFVVDYSINSGTTFTSNAIVTTGQKIVMSNVNIGWGYEFKYKVRGGTDSTYSPASAVTASSNVAEVNAFGIITASQISSFSLSSINANIGDISAGQLRNALNTAGILFSNTIPATWTRGIFFANGNPPPGTVTDMYIDFSATGTNNLLFHPGVALKANGTAIFSGTITAGSLVAGTIVAFSETLGKLTLGSGYSSNSISDSLLQMVATPVNHGLSGYVPTNTVGVISPINNVLGGITIQGIFSGTGNSNEAALLLTGITKTRTVGWSQNSPTIVAIETYESSGNNRSTPSLGANVFQVRVGNSAALTLDSNGISYFSVPSDQFYYGSTGKYSANGFKLSTSNIAGGGFFAIVGSGIAFPGGVAGTNFWPNYTFDGDFNTGMFSPAGDNIAFTVGGTRELQIFSGAALIYHNLLPQGNVSISSGTLITNVACIFSGTVSIPGAITGAIHFDGAGGSTIRWGSSITGTKAMSLGSNGPAPVTTTANPTAWVGVQLPNGTTGWMPVWQ